MFDIVISLPGTFNEGITQDIFGTISSIYQLISLIEALIIILMVSTLTIKLLINCHGRHCKAAHIVILYMIMCDTYTCSCVMLIHVHE